MPSFIRDDGHVHFNFGWTKVRPYFYIKGELNMTFLNMMDELKYQNVKYEVNKKLEKMIFEEGYTLFEPDFFEDYESFVLKNQRVKKDKMIKLIDSDGKILVLRPDITTSLMRQIIPKWKKGSILRIFYNSTIFSRTNSNQLDTIRQFGVELLGDGTKEADLEVLSLMKSVFELFSLDYVIEVTDTRFIEALIAQLGLNEKEKNIFKDILFRKSTYDLNAFVASLDVREDMKIIVRSLFTLQGSLVEVEEKMKQLTLSNQAKHAFESLNEKIQVFSKSQKFMIDLSLVSQYDYYDGILFKGYIKGSKEDILSGGRYAPLTENYGQRIDAIGFTLNTQEVIKEVLRNE